MSTEPMDDADPVVPQWLESAGFRIQANGMWRLRVVDAGDDPIWIEWQHGRLFVRPVNGSCTTNATEFRGKRRGDVRRVFASLGLRL